MSEYDNVIRQTFGTANPALPAVVGDIASNPDQAARAMELASVTGAPASAIFDDLEEFERQNKAQLASEIVRGNPHIADFVSRSPMVPKIANDDYGNLDSVSQKTSALDLPMKVLRAPEALAKILWPDDPLHRFTEGGPLGSWILKPEVLQNQPFLGAVAAGLGTPIELVLRGLGGVQNTAADAAYNLMDAAGQRSLGRDFAGMIESAGLTGRLPVHDIPVKVADQYFGARSHLENGREPPPTVLPEYDQYRAEVNKKDVEALTDVVKDAQSSLVRERNPDLFRDFIRQHTDAEIGISGDAVAALYGDKLPLPDDGLLGWVPNIATQLDLARRSGDDISVPLADWVAKIEPDVMKVLAEDIRVRPGNITAREAQIDKELQAEGPRPPPLPEEVPTQRAASALEPMFSIGDRKLELQRMAPKYTGESIAKRFEFDWADLDENARKFWEEAALAENSRFGVEQGFHDFILLDEKGNTVGFVNLSTQRGGKDLWVDNISGVNGLGPRDFGPALMWHLRKQIREEFPEAERLGGHRVSGMREKMKTWDQPSAEVWIRLDRKEADSYYELRDVLSGGQWETFSPSTKGYIVPDAMRAEQTRELVNIVYDELDRIVPKKVAIQAADTIKVEAGKLAGQRAGEDIRVGGTYIPFKDSYPIILFSLDSDNVLGSARHEAIHHLRQYGFFNAEEWATLEAQALAGRWLEKHKIDRRYPTANPSLKLEEAIAEAYMEWAQGRDKLRERQGELANVSKSPLDAIFEKMKAFFDAIKERISQLLGKDATWEDVFQRVDTGEVGRREGTKPLDARAFDERAAVMAKDALEAARGRDNEIEILNTRIKAIQSDMRTARRFGDDTKSEEFAPHRNAIQALRNRIYELDPLAERAQVLDEPPADPARVFQRANALGMTIEQYKRYEKLIEKRHAEDIAQTTERVTAAQKRVQTKQWKEDRAALRQQVVDEINLRPDIAADNYFADGVLYGTKVEKHEKLGTDFLTEEQRAGLPRDYYRKDGVHPDDLAPLFGFPDGASLVQHLSSLSEVRRQSGMRPIEFKRRMIDLETDRQMRLKYGVLEENILDAVKEQVASETQLNLLAEETIYYGVKSGKEPAFDQAQIKQFVADEFERASQTSVSSDRYLAAAGRAGRIVENTLLKQDFEAAFREKQRQYYATLLARNAVEFEAQVAKFEKLSAKLAKREVKAVEPEYLDFIHELMLNAGIAAKRSLKEIEDSKLHHGNADLATFVESKRLEGYDIAIGESILSGVKPLDQMTVGEMKEFMDAITSLNHVGREVRKIEIAGEKADWADFRKKIIDNISQLPARSRASQGRWLYKIDASLTRMEEIAKDLDLRTELGPLHQAVIEPMMRSKAKEFDMMTDLSKHFQETRGSFDHKWRKSLNDTIEQDVLHDPYTQTAYDMTRENLIQVMLNWGNRSNIRKFVQGAAVAKFGRRLDREEFAVYEAQIKALIDKHATAEDWQFVQRMWEPFKKWEPEMATVSRNTSGVVPKLIEPTAVETPFGTFDGGYWPVKYDRLGSNISTIEDRKPKEDGVFGADYFRAATAKGYLKERTGYVDFVDISTSLEQAAGTMQQTIHDIAFRDSLIQAGKVFYDKGIRAAIRKHYGSEYEAQLVPWLRRIAHQFSTDDSSIAGYNDFMRRVRINLVGHALPLNLKVILSPDIGVPNPKAWASYLANRSDNVKLAMEKSDEIRHLVYNMDRDYREGLDRITTDPNVRDIQKKAVQWGFVPIAKVSQEFRIATFVDQYYKALGRGKTEQEAALIADSYVRERHGAASVVDLPAVMQSNEGMKMLTMFYGFFNTMYNWQRQLPGNVRRREWDSFGANALGAVVVGAAFGAALFNQRKQDDSWFKIVGKALLLQPLSTIPIVREAASYAFEGYQPRAPFASLLGAAGSIYTDAKRAYKGEPVKKPITHVANVVGLSTGLPLAQVGRTGQFAADVYNRRQRPKNIAEWARGIISGEAQLKR